MKQQVNSHERMFGKGFWFCMFIICTIQMTQSVLKFMDGQVCLLAKN